MGTRRDLNAIAIGEREFLLTVGSGEAVHLAGEAGSDEVGRDAVPDHYLEDFEQVYDMTAIAAPRWLETTLCGRQWVLMACGEDTEDEEAVFAPTCRRCLAIMDKLFPAPELDPRFPLVVQVVSDTVIEHGTAEIHGVPGDHQAALRKEVRAAVRNRTGYGMETYAHEAMVIFVCQPIYDQHELEHARFAAEAMNRVVDKLLKGEEVEPMQSPTRLSWAAWATG